MADDDEDSEVEFDLSPGAWQSRNPDSAYEQVQRGLPVGDSEDLTRILNLPRRAPVTECSPTSEALIAIGMRKFARVRDHGQDIVAMDAHLEGDYERARDVWGCQCREIDPQRFVKRPGKASQPCIARLLWIQAWMLYEMEIAGGLIGSVTVGAGKTLVNLLAPLALRNCPLAVLLIPPSLVDQIETDYRLLAEHFRVPGLIIHQPGNKTWRADAAHRPDGGGPEPTLHVLPYTKLSTPTSSAWIDRLKPAAIIADEVDALKDLSSARTLRVARYIAQNWRTTRFCGWTGSLTDSAIADFGHLSAWALRDGSPMPLRRSVVDEWGRCLDAVPSPAPPGALIRLLNPGEGATMSNVRRAFRRRLADTTGFVMVGGRQVITASDGREVENIIRERAAPPLPQRVLDALAIVRRGRRPDTLIGGQRDDILEDPMQQAKCARDVATGVFHRWIFPRQESQELIDEWYEARALWFSELRRRVVRGEVHLDSPALCEAAAKRAWGDSPRDASLPEWHAEHWPRWRDVRELVQPQPQAERLDSFLVDDAATWAAHNCGIVWYQTREFAAWCRERARELYGLDLPIFGANSGREIARELGNRSIIASIEAHGRGRNGLQFAFSTQLVTQAPSSDRRAQQLLARAHRRGQESGEVVTWLYLHTDEVQEAFDQALRRGEYVEAVTGESRKLLEGWDSGRRR